MVKEQRSPEDACVGRGAGTDHGQGKFPLEDTCVGSGARKDHGQGNNLRRMIALAEVLVYPNCRSFVPGNLEMVEELAVSLRTDNSQ